MKKIISSIAAVAAITTLATAGGDIVPVEPVAPAPTSSDAYNVSLVAGTLGVGVNVSQMITDSIGIRGNINGFSYSEDWTPEEATYNGDLSFITVGALVDYYPMDNNFRLSAGVYYNGNKVDGTATPGATEQIDIGDGTYTGAEIGSISTGVDFNPVTPYVGIGWGNKSTYSGWGFSLDVGAMYQGSPNVYANASINQSLPDDVKKQIQNDVEKERADIEDSVSKYKWYPVIMIGVTYSF